MLSNARLYGEKRNAGTPAPMIRADELVYFEDAQRIDLHGNVVLERGTQRVSADDAFVFLQDGVLSRIEATHAAGVDSPPGRQIEFQADRLEVHYGTGNAVERIAGARNTPERNHDEAAQRVIVPLIFVGERRAGAQRSPNRLDVERPVEQPAPILALDDHRLFAGFVR